MVVGRFARPRRRLRAGLLQLICVLAGLGLGLLLPRITTEPSVASTQVTQSLVTVGFGILGLVSIIFSLLFLVVQWAFSSLSPRLNLFRDDPIVWRTFGLAIGIFVFSVTAALAIGNDPKVSVILPVTEVAAVLAAIALIRTLQVKAFASIQLAPTLSAIAARGRAVIDALYRQPGTTSGRRPAPQPPLHRTVTWPHRQAVLQQLDLRRLLDASDTAVIVLREPAEAAGESAADPPATLEMDTESALITRIRDRHAAVRELISSGCAVIPAARQLGLSRNTVRRYAQAASVGELLESAARPSNLDAFKPYLHERWNAGQTRPSRLFEEISALGYSGSNANVRDYVRRLRAWAEASPEVTPPPPVRVVVTWIARHPDRLDPADQERLAAILGRCPELDALSTRIREFAAMMGHRLGDRLPRWLASARATSLPGLQSFAAGIEKDQAAVTAGLTLNWSSGPVEGHVNRIKMLKRQMYGRASTDLLRKRVLMLA